MFVAMQRRSLTFKRRLSTLHDAMRCDHREQDFEGSGSNRSTWNNGIAGLSPSAATVVNLIINTVLRRPWAASTVRVRQRVFELYADDHFACSSIMPNGVHCARLFTTSRSLVLPFTPHYNTRNCIVDF